MGLTAYLYDSPFYTGGHTAGAEVPNKYPVGLNGRGFLVDLKTPYANQRFHHSSIPILRPQQDTGTEVGERSLNPEAFWRRSQSTWHKGSGQTYLDLTDSDRARFRSSKGVDVWTKNQISLLNDTASKRASANTNLRLVPVGTYLYLTDGTEIRRTQDVTVTTPTWTNVTGVPAGAPVSIASDGYNVWTAHTGNGIYLTTRGAATTASYATGNATLVAFVKGRLMAAYQNNIYNVVTGGGAAIPAALFTHGNTDFAWVGFGEGRRYIYAAGYSGDKSLVYATQVKTDGTALDAPFVAAELPDGEIVRSIQGYLGGYVFLGTDKGVRFCIEDSANGGLQVGALIPTTSGVYAFEPQDRFVWYGLTNYDGVSTGLGRMDLRSFTDTAGLAPAYATDLMATTQGLVSSIASFQNIRVFGVSGVGVYAQSTNLVSTGSIDSGLITYDLADDKTAVFLDVKHGTMPAGSTHQAWIAGDDGDFHSVGIHTSTSAHGKFSAGQIRGFAFEIRETLNRATVATTGPTLYRHTLQAEVSANPGANIIVPLILSDRYELLSGGYASRDVVDDLAFVKGLRADRTVATYQEGSQSYQVLVDDFDWMPHHLSQNKDGYVGTLIAKLKVVS